MGPFYTRLTKSTPPVVLVKDVVAYTGFYFD